jgi:hypothetical protein
MLFKKKVTTDKVTVDVNIDIKGLETERKAIPAPYMATKPADVVGYCFGFVCPSHHVNYPFESITTDGLRERKVCQTCGEVSRPATVKTTAEAQWVHKWFTSKDNHEFEWTQYSRFGRPFWTKIEFIKFLEAD